MKECMDNVRKNVPLVHNITNYVTVNDVANILLACGGSPIMSDEPEDVEDITSVCGGLNINIGTLHQSSIEGMLPGRKQMNWDIRCCWIRSERGRADFVPTRRFGL